MPVRAIDHEPPLHAVAGASGVGAAAIQIAKDTGATVFVTASSKEKLDFCKVHSPS